MKILPIKTKSKHYNIYIGNNTLSKFSKIIKKENLRFKKSLIIVDKKVPKVFLNKLKTKIKVEKSIVYLFSASEKKHIHQSIKELEEQLLVFKKIMASNRE